METAVPPQILIAGLVETITFDQPQGSWVDLAVLRPDDQDERDMLHVILRLASDTGDHLAIADRTESGSEALKKVKQGSKSLATFREAIRVLDRHRHGTQQNIVVLRDGEAPRVTNARLDRSDALIKDLFLTQIRHLLVIADSARTRARVQADWDERFSLPAAQAGWADEFADAASLALEKYVEFQGALQDLERKRRQEIHVSGARKGSKSPNTKQPELFRVAKDVPKASKPARSVAC